MDNDICTDGSARTHRRAIAAAASAAAGNALEYYDFAVYGYMAAIIGHNFFPSKDPLNSLLASFAVFGVGFLARPIGGVLIGQFADVRGRKPAVILCIFLMAAGTLLTGLVPGYERIGVVAPILIVTARLMQGFAIGGGAGSSMAFIVEWAPEGRRGFYGSLQQCSSTSGFLLGSGIAALCSSLFTPAEMQGWGWRIPFLIGSLVGPIGIYMQRHVHETPAFEEEGKRRSAAAEDSAFILTARAFGLTILWTVAFYVFLAFMPTFTRTYAHLTPAMALWSNTIGLVAVVISIPLVGALSDRVGRRPVLLAGCLGFIVLPYPLFALILSGPPFGVTVLVQVTLGVMLALLCGTNPATISEIFPTKSRTMLMSLGYGLCVAIFGGFAPFTATWLISHTGSPLSPALFVMASGLISGVVIYRLRETAYTPLR
jgi:MHS family proline/betaine transporter-like MFS transporter